MFKLAAHEPVVVDSLNLVPVDTPPIFVVEVSRLRPAPVVVVTRESTPSGEPPVIIFRGERTIKDVVVFDRRVDKSRPLVIIDQRENPVDGNSILLNGTGAGQPQGRYLKWARDTL